MKPHRPAAWSIGVPKEEDVDKVKALIEGNTDRFKAAMGDRMIRGLLYKGMDKVEDGFMGKQYVLLYNTFCDVKDWEDVRAISLEIAYKILVENGITPVSGDLRPL